ncbi:MAG: tetratricopeptide repeat protein [Cytophagaceae bacterium]|nr:tetratricopeptide repeat protein [Cytophagaceae bacterium]
MIRKILIIFSLFAWFSGNSQSVSFEKALGNLKKEKEFDYLNIDTYLKEFKGDSLIINKLAGQSDFPEGKIYALIVKGINTRNKSEYKASLGLLQNAINEAQNVGNTDLYIYALNMLGVTYRRMDEVRLALDNHKLALSHAEKINPKTESILRSIAISQNSIGNIYLSLKQYDLAYKQFEKSLSIEKKLNNKLGLAINYQNLGIIAEAQNDLPEALKNYKASLNYNLEINSALGKIICNNSIGQVLIKQNKAVEGLKFIQPTIKLSEELGDKYYMTLARINSGWAQTKLKNYSDAETNLRMGLDIAIQNDFKSSASEAYEHLANLYEAKGDYKNALLNMKLKQKYGEKVLNEENLRYTQELILKYDSEKKENQIRLLEKENELVKYKLRDNQRIMVFAAILFAMLGVLFLIWYRQYQLKNEKKVLMLEQQMLRSQMNPHFLFNSLNSIKLFIINNEKETAVYYLNKFSKLIRTILSNSQEKEISLKEELETMALYLNIENIRFTEKINYEVKIEDGLNPEEIKIPSLILQPFIENAIWHGLSNKKGDKNLKINIQKIEDFGVRFEIIDNGIGRELAQKIKDSKVSKQTSIGLKLTKERLQNFAKNLSKTTEITFVDLYDSLKNPTGTKAIITIPIK